MSASTRVLLSCLLLFLHFNFAILNPDRRMRTLEIIQYYGYECQTHSVTTEDGYILNMHRIPSGRNFSKRLQKIPVLLVHGIFGSSYVWVGNTDKTSLGFLMADAGYDVWMGNFRGTSYSHKHVNLSYSDQKYWDFCFDQHGTIDVPTMVDYILNLTNQRSLLLTCHSMGCLNSVIMLSTKPEYKFKVRGIIAFAPAWNMTYFGGLTAVIVKKLFPILIPLANYLNIWSFPPVQAGNAGFFICKDIPFICFIFYNLMDKFNFFGYNLNRVDEIFYHFPDVSSVRTLQHYFQWFRKKESGTMFDFENYAINNIHYKQVSPLKYNFQVADVPIAIMVAVNDHIVDLRGVNNTAALLPRVKLFYEVPNDNFNHLSFLWGVNAKELVYDKTIEMLRVFSQF